MIVTNLESLPDESRLWVYQSNRPFTADEQGQIEDLLQQFLASWAAHGQELKAAYSIFYSQFIVIAVDESMHGASGCSIDASVGLIRDIETHFNLSLLDRTQVAILKEELVALVPFNQVKGQIESGNISEDSIVFNNAVASFGEWKSHWKQPASQSWMARFFPAKV